MIAMSVTRRKAEIDVAGRAGDGQMARQKSGIQGRATKGINGRAIG